MAASIVPEKLTYLEPLQLSAGNHPAPNNGLAEACVMEAVAYITNEPWTDHPACVSPVIAQFLRSWNDSLPDADRQMLKPYIVKVVDTNTGAKDEETRAWMVTDWLVRECAPAFMRPARLTEQAGLVEQLAPLTSAKSARKAQPTLNRASKESAAAWAAAGAAAGAAARDAARDAAAAGAAAWAAAWDAAGDAAWAAAWAAAGAAARAALAPTVSELQASALLLLNRLIAVGRC